MRINGQWLLCDDAVMRPVIQGKILTDDGSWQEAEFLVDTAADRTAFSFDILTALALDPVEVVHSVESVERPRRSRWTHALSFWTNAIHRLLSVAGSRPSPIRMHLT